MELYGVGNIKEAWRIVNHASDGQTIVHNEVCRINIKNRPLSVLI